MVSLMNYMEIDLYYLNENISDSQTIPVKCVSICMVEWRNSYSAAIHVPFRINKLLKSKFNGTWCIWTSRYNLSGCTDNTFHKAHIFKLIYLLYNTPCFRPSIPSDLLNGSENLYVFLLIREIIYKLFKLILFS